MSRITKIVAIAIVSTAAFLAGMLSSGIASAHPHHQTPGVCVTTGTFPLIDRDLNYVARIYTPGAGGTCAKGDEFVSAVPAS